MASDLTIRTYLKYYMFHPNELPQRKERLIVKIANVVLTIFTAGILPVANYFLFYDPNFKKVKQPINPQPLPKPNPTINPQPLPKPGPTPIQQNPLAQTKFGTIEVEISHIDDIASLNHDAIVNAANQGLLPGSGVCGAIYKAGLDKNGQDTIFAECQQYLKDNGLTQLPEGEAMITGAGALKAKHVIHAVGPEWKGGEEKDNDCLRLYNAYYRILEIADQKGLKTVASPSLSTGIFGFPKDIAALIAIQAVKDFAQDHPGNSLKVTFALWPNHLDHFKKALTQIAKQNDALKGSEALLLPFYREKGVDDKGRRLQDIWNYTDTEKEDKHDFIQWLFPGTSPSGPNPTAPILNQGLIKEMKHHPVIRHNLKKSFDSMLHFYGLHYDSSKKQVIEGSNFAPRTQDWFTKTHNFLRITRMLACLRKMGLTREADAFYAKLEELHKANPGIFGASFKFWTEAVGNK